MEKLSNIEFDITKELFSIALANVADSFSKMARDKVLIKKFDAKYTQTNEIKESLAFLNGDKQYVLHTEVKGKMKGRIYLIFSEEDVQKIFKIFAPTPIHDIDKNGVLSDIQKDILLELDNILSAAMVTKLSDFLDIFIYGDIPKCNFVKKDQIEALLTEDIKGYNSIIQTLCTLNSDTTKLQPLFLCFFEDDFINVTKEAISNRESKILQKIKVSKLQRD